MGCPAAAAIEIQCLSNYKTFTLMLVLIMVDITDDSIIVEELVNDVDEIIELNEMIDDNDSNEFVVAFMDSWPRS